MKEQQEVEAKRTESSDDEIKRLDEERTVAREDKRQLKEVRINKCIRNKSVFAQNVC